MRMFFFAALLLYNNSPLCAQDTVFSFRTHFRTEKLPFGLSRKVPSSNKKVAFAMSGGGVRGLAQIGILKAFEEEGIKPDIIFGTSMGSIVGGLYAAGFSPDEIDSLTRTADWEYLLSPDDRTNRRSQFIDKKITEDRSVLTLRLKGLEPIVPNSINDGQKMLNFFTLLTTQAPLKTVATFSDYEIPFRAICTNLATGEPVMLDRGALADAMRASSSVTFLLSPVKYDSIYLVDGGLSANIPVEPARKSGADIVVAFNTTSPLHTGEEMLYPWNIADQVVSIPMKIINDRQLALADLVISPQLGNKATGDFTNIEEVVYAGYIAGKTAAHKISYLLDSLNTLPFNTDKKPYLISEIVLPASFEKKEFPFTPGTSYLLKDITLALYNIEEKGNYDSLSCVLVKLPEGYRLVIGGKKNPVIENVSFSGITVLDDTDISQIFTPYIGKSYIPETAYKLTKVLLTQYRMRGFSLAEVASVQFNPENGSMFVSIEEGTVDSIYIQGHLNTAETVIRREIPIAVGSLFRVENLRSALSNITNTGLFDKTTVSLKKLNGRNILVFNVRERETNLIRLGFKIENENFPQLSLDTRNENLFGTGTELGLFSFLSPRKLNITVEQKATRIFNSYFTYNLSALWGWQDINTYERKDPDQAHFERTQTGEYRQTIYGLDFSVGSQTGRWGKFIVTGKAEKHIVKNRKNTPVDEISLSLIALRGILSLDTQDKYPYPTKGFRFNAFYESASEKFGSDIGYTAFGGEYKGYTTWLTNHTLSLGATIGFGDRTVPLTQQFSLGGQNEFWGTRENEYRGRQIAVAKLEYRYQLPFKIFFDAYLSFRYDIGNVWLIQNQIRFADLRHGIGTTLSLDTPVGPADLSIGRTIEFIDNITGSPIKRGPLYVYFSLGFYY